MVKKTNKVKDFGYREVKDYVNYVGDSFTHARQQVPGNVVRDIMDSFHKINVLVRRAKKRYGDKEE